MSKKYEAEVLEICDNGDAIIELPLELMTEMGWKEGDELNLEMEMQPDLIIVITKLNKEVK